MQITVLGPGCGKCRTTYERLRDAAEGDPDIHVTKVEDLTEMLRLGILTTPAVVIDGRVVLSGRVPSRREVAHWLESAPR